MTPKFTDTHSDRRQTHIAQAQRRKAAELKNTCLIVVSNKKRAVDGCLQVQIVLSSIIFRLLGPVRSCVDNGKLFGLFDQTVTGNICLLTISLYFQKFSVELCLLKNFK